MADYIVEEIVNHNQNATHNDENIHENKVEIKQENVQQDEDRGAESTPSERGNAPFEVKPTKPKAKPKANSKPKLQEDTGKKLTNAEMKEMADINNQFYALLNRIQKIPNLNDKLTKEVLKDKKTQIKVNDEIINLKDSNYITIEVI